MCVFAGLRITFWIIFMIILGAFQSFALFNSVKLLLGSFRIHKASFLLPGTSLASQLSHLNVFNLRRIADYSNDMLNLIYCVVLPLVSSLSAAGFASGKENAFMSEKKWKEERNSVLHVSQVLRSTIL